MQWLFAKTAKKYAKEVHDNSVFRIVKYCVENSASDLSLDSVASALYLNKYYISHVFSDKIGIPFNTFINNQRISMVCDLLKSTDMAVIDAAYECGFKHQGSFNRIFKQTTNMTPREYRKAYKR